MKGEIMRYGALFDMLINGEYVSFDVFDEKTKHSDDMNKSKEELLNGLDENNKKTFKDFLYNASVHFHEVRDREIIKIMNIGINIGMDFKRIW